MGQSTFLIALIHFASELFIFQSIKLNRASISPLIIARESCIPHPRVRLARADLISHESSLDHNATRLLHKMIMCIHFLVERKIK
jgi:hypothetical protein